MNARDYLMRMGHLAPAGCVSLWNAKRPTSRFAGPQPVYASASQQPDANGNLVDWPNYVAGRGVEVHPAYSNVYSPAQVNVSTTTGWAVQFAACIDGLFVPTAATGTHDVLRSFTGVAAVPYAASIRVESAGLVELQIYGRDKADAVKTSTINTITGAIVANNHDVIVEQDGTGWIIKSKHLTSTGTLNVYYQYYNGALGDGVSGFRLSKPMMVQSSYHMPYIPPGTSVASTAATSAGNGLAIPMDARMRECFERSVTDGVEKAPGTSPTLMRKVDWSVLGEDATHILTDVAGGLRYQSDTASPTTLQIYKANVLVVGVVYKITVKQSGWVSGQVKLPCFGDQAIATGNHTTTYTRTATSTTLNVYRVSDGVDLILDTLSIQRLAPSVFTAAALVYMGVGSGEIPTDTGHNVLSQNDTALSLSHFQDSAGSKRISRTYDGTSGPNIASTWNRGEIHLKVVQTNALGTQFRVGNRRYTSAMVPIDALTWGAWANYDGSMSPLTHLRFGYNSTVPIGFLQTQVWGKSCSDAEILNLLRYAL